MDLRTWDETPTSQRDLRGLQHSVPADLDAALLDAIEQRREHAFTNLLLAGLAAGRKVHAAVLARGAGLLPDPDVLAAVAGQLEGDVGQALVTAVRGRTLGYEREPQALLVAELWSRRKGVARAQGLVAEARIRARRQLTHEGEDAIVALNGLLDDPDLAALVEGIATPEVKDAARVLASRLVDRLVSPVLAGLPERARRESRGGGPVRRAAVKLGRNDPCHCGSGKKYKLCHEAIDRERVAESSDIAGLTRSELEAELEKHLTRERLLALRGHEIARLDPRRVPPELRTDFADQLALWGEIDAAAAAVEAWIPEGGELDPGLDDVLRLVAEHAARLERPDLTRRLVALRGGRTDELLLEAKVALHDDPVARIEALEQAARAELDARGVDVGFALMASGFPALGIHVARAELVLRQKDPHTESLYATLLETRDRLGVAPWDPIDHVVYTLDHGVAPEVDRELEAARSRIEGSDAALRATQEALEKLRAELERKEAARPPEPSTPQPAALPSAPERHDEEVRELRERLERLKGELKQRHHERNALRRELEETRDQMAKLETQHGEDDETVVDETIEDEDEGPAFAASVAARVRVPVFPEDFDERLREVPEATARAALMRVGELCAGFDTAFREVRPLRGFEGTWRVKVGRSYRLLFRPLDRTLEVVDLLHRQDLEKRLFRLRRGGE